jgi:flagellar biogenesis protein FliO
LEDEAPATNYALRLTEDIDEAEVGSTVRRGLRPVAAPVEEDSFALRLNEALQAISAAQSEATPAATDERATRKAERATLGTWLGALDKLPPIRLPIGPPIPWRLGLPVLVALVVLMGVVSRSAGTSEPQGVQLPAQQTYPVQQEAPLFAKAQPTDTAQAEAPAQVQAPAQAQAQAPAPQSLGAPEAPGLGFDLADIGLKLIVVLALAYGSLMLLRRAGIGGAGPSRNSGPTQDMRVTSSLALAPNRSVHVIRVPGGRTLLVGATPNAVNLIADLGDLTEDETPEANSLLDALKGKIGS